MESAINYDYLTQRREDAKKKPEETNTKILCVFAAPRQKLIN